MKKPIVYTLSIVVVIALVYSLYSLAFPFDAMKQSNQTVWKQTKLFINDELTSPEKARYPEISNHNVEITNRGDYTYHVKGYVDALNIYNGYTRVRFDAVVRCDSEGKWKLISFEKAMDW